MSRVYPILEELEVFRSQVGDIAAFAIGHRDVQRNEINTGTERRLVPGLLCDRGRDREGDGSQGRADMASHS